MVNYSKINRAMCRSAGVLLIIIGTFASVAGFKVNYPHFVGVGVTAIAVGVFIVRFA